MNPFRNTLAWTTAITAVLAALSGARTQTSALLSRVSGPDASERNVCARRYTPERIAWFQGGLEEGFAGSGSATRHDPCRIIAGQCPCWSPKATSPIPRS